MKRSLLAIAFGLAGCAHGRLAFDEAGRLQSRTDASAPMTTVVLDGREFEISTDGAEVWAMAAVEASRTVQGCTALSNELQERRAFERPGRDQRIEVLDHLLEARCRRAVDDRAAQPVAALAERKRREAEELEAARRAEEAAEEERAEQEEERRARDEAEQRAAAEVRRLKAAEQLEANLAAGRRRTQEAEAPKPAPKAYASLDDAVDAGPFAIDRLLDAPLTFSHWSNGDAMFTDAVGHALFVRVPKELRTGTRAHFSKGKRVRLQAKIVAMGGAGKTWAGTVEFRNFVDTAELISYR